MKVLPLHFSSWFELQIGYSGEKKDIDLSSNLSVTNCWCADSFSLALFMLAIASYDGMTPVEMQWRASDVNSNGFFQVSFDML